MARYAFSEYMYERYFLNDYYRIKSMNHQTISLEFLTAGKNNDQSSFTTKLSELGQSIRTTLLGSNKVASEGWKYSADSLSFVKYHLKDDAEYQSYMNVREKTVYVPPGFKGSMVSFSALLLDGARLLAKLESDYIRPIETQLSMCLASPDRFKKTHTSECVDLGAKQLNQIYDNINSYFSGTLRSDQANLSDVYARLKDIDMTADHLIETLKITQELTPVRMNSRAMVLSSLVDKLVIRMKQKPENFELNGMNAKVIGEMTYTLARVFKFYATMHNNITMAVHALVDTFND